MYYDVSLSDRCGSTSAIVSKVNLTSDHHPIFHQWISESPILSTTIFYYCMWNVLDCLACASIWTTSLIVGLSTLCSWTHSMATKKTCIASFSGIPVTLWSKILITLSLIELVCIFVHWTMSSPSSPKSPTGLLPVISSSSTTPKLYTSLFSSTFKVYAYSVTR